MCKSIVFFAVPHTGSGWANIFKYGKILLRSSEVIKELARNTEQLHNLSMEFDAFVGQKNIDTFVFYERIQVRSPKIWSWLHLRKGINIVSKESATHIRSNNQKVPLPENHISICKISSRESDTYDNRMRTIMNKMLEVSEKFKMEQKEKEKKEDENNLSSTIQNHYGKGDNVVTKTVINKSVTVGGSSSGVIITGDNNTVG